MLLFQKVVRFSYQSFGLHEMSDCPRKPSEVRISAWAVERGDALKWTCKPNMKARKLQANLNIAQIAPRLTEICSV